MCMRFWVPITNTPQKERKKILCAVLLPDTCAWCTMIKEEWLALLTPHILSFLHSGNIRALLIVIWSMFPIAVVLLCCMTLEPHTLNCALASFLHPPPFFSQNGMFSMHGACDTGRPGQLEQAHFIRLNTQVGVVCQTPDPPLHGHFSVLFQNTAAVEGKNFFLLLLNEITFET